MSKKGKGKNIRYEAYPIKDRPFINPYNFVCVTNRVERYKVEKGDFTGKIKCRLFVKEQLAIPDIKGENEQYYDFYHVNGHYGIPGSEIKGCIRSVFEALTPSCFGVINSEILSAREAKPSTSRKPGILMRTKGKWVIYQAEYYSEKKYNRIKPSLSEPDVIRRWQKKSDEIELCNTYFYFSKGETGEKEEAAECTDEDIRKLKNTLDIYKINVESRAPKESVEKQKEEDKDKELHRLEELKQIEEYIDLIKDMETIDDSDNARFPLFYQADANGLKYISPAHTGRKVFTNTVPELLGEHKTCTGDDGKYCPACSLFGMIGSDSNASRVRFGDAKMDKGVISDDYKILPELSSPKISTVEFYSYVNPYDKDTPRWDYDSGTVRLNGRKFYFHGLPQTAPELGKRQVAVKTAQKNSEFVFDVYFDNVTEAELQELLWILTLGDNQPDSAQMHKIGMGRPVGYGSVKIVVEDILCRKVDAGRMIYTVSHSGYDKVIKGFSESVFFDEYALRDILDITCYTLTVNDMDPDKAEEIFRIAYPMGEKETGKSGNNDKAGHQWFTSNRVNKGKEKKLFRDVLPLLSDKAEDMILYDIILKPVYQDDCSDSKWDYKEGRKQTDTDLEVGREYEAAVIGSYTKKDNKYIKIDINGIRDSILEKHCPNRITDNTEKAIQTKAKIYVVYNGKNDKGYRRFWVNKNK